MIKLKDLRDLLEPLLELLNLRKKKERKKKKSSLFIRARQTRTHLLEVVTKLDHRRVLKHPTRIDHQLAVFQRIDITLDQQQIGARFHRKESATRDVDAVRAFKVFDGCTCRRLELDDGLAVV